MKLDDRNRKLMSLIQNNSRMSLTELAKKLSLSIDATKKRMDFLVENQFVSLRALIEPKAIGYDLIANVQIKLNNISEEEHKNIINYLKAHKNVIELISILGDYDLTCVIIAKNTQELEIISREIRNKFKNIISDWRSVINLEIHKFEEYDIMRL